MNICFQQQFVFFFFVFSSLSLFLCCIICNQIKSNLKRTLPLKKKWEFCKCSHLCACICLLFRFIKLIFVPKMLYMLNFVRDTRSFTTKLSSSQRTEYKGQPALYRFVQWKSIMAAIFTQTHCHLFTFGLPNRTTERWMCVFVCVRARVCKYMLKCVRS